VLTVRSSHTTDARYIQIRLSLSITFMKQKTVARKAPSQRSINGNVADAEESELKKWPTKFYIVYTDLHSDTPCMRVAMETRAPRYRADRSS